MIGQFESGMRIPLSLAFHACARVVTLRTMVRISISARGDLRRPNFAHARYSCTSREWWPATCDRFQHRCGPHFTQGRAVPFGSRLL